MINFCHINARAEGNLKDGDKEHLFVESLLGLEIFTREQEESSLSFTNLFIVLLIF